MGQVPMLLEKSNCIIKFLLFCSWILLILITLYKVSTEKVITMNIVEEGVEIAIRFFLILSLLKLAQWIKRNTLLEKLGQNSYTIYILHQPFCCGFMGTLLYNKLNMPGLFVCIVCIGLSFIIPYILIRIINKNKVVAQISKTLLNI